MKYRDIAKVLLLKQGAEESIVASDASKVGELAEGRDTFTPKQVGKIAGAMDDLSSSLRKKWKIEG